LVFNFTNEKKGKGSPLYYRDIKRKGEVVDGRDVVGYL